MDIPSVNLLSVAIEMNTIPLKIHTVMWTGVHEFNIAFNNRSCEEISVNLVYDHISSILLIRETRFSGRDPAGNYLSIGALLHNTVDHVTIPTNNSTGW